MERSADRLTPVLLVPGAGHQQRGWMLIRRHLERAGFGHVADVADAPPDADLPHLADHLAHHVELIRLLSGAERVHLVGHHVTGCVIRYYVQLLGGDAFVDTAITVATPHAGTLAAHPGLGAAASQLHPDSRVMRHLEDSVRPMSVRWVNYFSERDVLIEPAASAVLRHLLFDATNILVSDHPHLSLLLPPDVCRSVAHQLAAAEGVPGYGQPVTSLMTVGQRRTALSGRSTSPRRRHAPTGAP